MVLGVGALAAIIETRYIRIPIRDEPILALLGAFAFWGLIRQVCRPSIERFQHGCRPVLATFLP
jgi:hypothetical protein